MYATASKGNKKIRYLKILFAYSEFVYYICVLAKKSQFAKFFDLSRHIFVPGGIEKNTQSPTYRDGMSGCCRFFCSFANVHLEISLRPRKTQTPKVEGEKW